MDNVRAFDEAKMQDSWNVGGSWCTKGRGIPKRELIQYSKVEPLESEADVLTANPPRCPKWYYYIYRSALGNRAKGNPPL